jgi:uncharacterized protein YodC (DUF2158 family)
MNEVKEGAVVRLKSGGPSMNCVSVPDDQGKVLCTWFLRTDDKPGQTRTDWFTVDMLEVVKDDGDKLGHDTQ